MIPVLWRYAISQYSKNFFLSVGSIIAVLIVSRFKEIAQFAVFSASWLKTALFTLYQIPFILPMALPISTLLASFLLLQKMSRSHEITALRASGFSVCQILTPILLIAGFLSLGNFTLSAKIAPFCSEASLHILFADAPANPLQLLQRRKLLEQKNIYLQMEEVGDSVSQFVMIGRNGNTRHLELLAFDSLSKQQELLIGTNMALISHLGERSESGMKSLLIENQTTVSMAAPLLTEFLSKKPPKPPLRALDYRMLTQAVKYHKKKGKAAKSEQLRRYSLSLAVLSFTLLGCAFGLESDKKASKSTPLITLCLALLLLSSYFLGKGLRFDSIISALSFFFPHSLIWGASSWRIYRITKGT